MATGCSGRSLLGVCRQRHAPGLADHLVADGQVEVWRRTSSTTTTSIPMRPRAARSTASRSAPSTASIPTSCGHARPPASRHFGGGLLYDTLMEQATDEPSVSHPLIADAYKYPDDFSSATYRLDPRAKWHDGKPITADDVDLVVRRAEGQQPDLRPLLRQRDRGRRGRRSRGRVPLRPEGQSRTAARSSATWSCCPSTGGKAPTPAARSATSRSRRSSRRSARAPTRSRASSRARKSSGSACQDYWGADLPGEGRPREFRQAPLCLFPRRQCRMAGLHQGRLRGHPAREPLAALGDRLRLPGLQGRRRDQGRVRHDIGRADAGLRPQHAPAAVPGPARARRR